MLPLTILLLSVMEVSLSFDNAVINATVLRRMPPRWQRIFLTWGILVAVFGMRLVFPVLIVAVAAGVGVTDVARMAVNDPASYASHLAAAHPAIAAFGGMFLLMVFLAFACDEAKETHWLGWIERRLAKLGRMEAVEVALALTLLIGLQAFVPERLTALLAGVAGVASYVGVKGITGMCGDGENPAACMAGKAGLMAFIYLEVLDASFSLDGVIGAFAISNNIFVIMTGLGIGALCIRTLTVHLVRRGTLQEFAYLEHGAHWGIAALAVAMLASLRVHVPESVTGLAGAAPIGLALLSSIREKRRTRG